MEEICQQFSYCGRSGIVSSQDFVVPATRCQTMWPTDILNGCRVAVETNGTQCKILADSLCIVTNWHSFQPGFCCASDTVPIHVLTGQCGHRTFGLDIGWFYNDGGRFADMFLLLKTVVDSARQWRTLEDNGRSLPTV